MFRLVLDSRKTSYKLLASASPLLTTREKEEIESAGYDAIQSDPDRHPNDACDALDCALESRAARAFSCEAGAGASPIATNPTSSTSRTSDYVAAAAAAMAATHAQSGGAMRVSSHPDGIDNGSLPVVISRGQFPNRNTLSQPNTDKFQKGETERQMEGSRCIHNGFAVYVHCAQVPYSY
ncbi:hypothetical protein E4U35_004305 [Claviceps purpurea]|nr:hypothetical protein E4U35_004305 [Claviceps purpurea]KAG6279411.1 hypothetical protein E4U47_003423 [Claviceps purpurea]